MSVYLNRMVKRQRPLGPIPAMMSALERTAVSVTSDGRTERDSFPIVHVGPVSLVSYAGYGCFVDVPSAK